MDLNEELATIISDARYPDGPEQFVSSMYIAEMILDAGYTKKPISANRRMVNAALLKFFPGISTVAEITGQGDNIEQRMAEAIFAAFAAWKLEQG